MDSGPAEDAGAATSDAGDVGDDASTAMDSGMGGDDAGVRVDGGAIDPETANQIRAVRVATPGTHNPGLLVQDATVSFVSDGPGIDPAGFFVQASPVGPALFITIPAGDLVPAPSVGDRVDFEVRQIEVVTGMMRIPAITGWAVHGNRSLVGWPQDLSDNPMATNADTLESELVQIEGVLSTQPTHAGVDQVSCQVRTTSVDSESLTIRGLESSFVALGLQSGCTVRTRPTPVWRHDNRVQVQLFSPDDIVVVGDSCPSFQLLSARATDADEVELQFNRALSYASLSAADFTIAGPTAVTVTSARADMSVVTLQLSREAGLGTFTVTANDITDRYGAPISTEANTATFEGGEPASLVFSEYVEGSAQNKALEISNRGGLSAALRECEIRIYINGTMTSPRTITLSDRELASGNTHVVCPATAGSALLDRSDQTHHEISQINGDDAIELVCRGVVVDSIGTVGFDPGASWSDGGVSTVNMTIRRNCSVTAGDSDSTDAFVPSEEWSAFAFDTFADVGNDSCVAD